uniref:Plexin b1b n=1 Tax=Gadus morhua TaxID=8049 RepID=A0A8C5CM62_GADMO
MVQRTAGALGPLSVLLLAATVASALTPPPYPSFSRNDTLFEHLALHPDPSVGRVYVGGRDRLYQLDRALALELQDDTGPVTDSRECLPPVTQGNCPQARLTPNHNKLLLVDPYSMELIACGSVNQGICQKRSLVNISAVLFSAQRPVDTQYVAANDPEVSTVGLVVRSRPERQPVLYVGRGYTSSHPPISTRNLQQEPVFSYEETAKLAVAGRLSEYDHHFVASFARRRHVYFLFYRRDLKSLSREYRSYVSRVCLDDQAYYSYVEVPLTCRSGAGKVYNLLQAVRLGGAKPGSEVLLGVFSTRLASSAQPSDDSALCTFRLVELERRINATRDLCYTQSGREAGGDAAYIEYDVKSNCANLPENTLEAYPCGSDHTPSPMASRTPVVAETILHSPSARLTAVAVSVRDDHTIAFLGDSKGNLHKVYLGPNGEVEEYAVVPVQPNTPISSDLILDQKEEHLFIMTSTMKRPVAECHIHTDCDSCLQGHDPYCGWCVLEGSCALQSQCKRSNKTGQWLWSFDMEQQCLSVQDLQPSNVSRDQSRMVSADTHTQKHTQTHCTRRHAQKHTITQTRTHRQEHRSAQSQTHSIVFLNITTLLCPLYDTSNHSLSPRCHGCVESRWGCNWCVHQHLCTYKSSCEEGVVIYNQHVSGTCPRWCFHCPHRSRMCRHQSEQNTPVTITDRPALSNHSRSLPSVTLYNCSAGRADCSRCHTVDRKYDCVWCGGRRASCLYSESCGSEAVQQTCPAPLIHKIEPLSGLLEGGTQVTIWGSNLGQKAEDVLHTVRVVSVPCTVIPGLYQISTRIVCKTQASGGEKVGQVSVEVSGGERGLSSQMFSYQVMNHTQCLHAVICSAKDTSGITSSSFVAPFSSTNLPLSLPFSPSPSPLPPPPPPPPLPLSVSEVKEASVVCVTGASNRSGEQRVTLHYGASQRHLHTSLYRYTPNPNVTRAAPASSFLKYAPRVCVCVWGYQRCRCVDPLAKMRRVNGCLFTERCEVNSSSLILCRSPAVDESVWGSEVTVEFLLDNLRFPFSGLSAQLFHYQPNPLLHSLNRQEPLKAYRYNPGSFIQLEGENLDLAITKEEVVVLVGEGVCAVKTLTRNHLYCEPPPQQPGPGPNGVFQVQMGNLNFSLGKVQYDTMSLATFPMEARIGVGVGASIVALIVFIIVLIYRRKSKQALRDYKKVQIQLENLETSVRDRCKKEFTDLMTEMMDMSSDLVGSGIPFLDYKKYAERIFFPGHRESPLRRDLDVQECRRQTVEQGLVQLSNLLNSKLFLTKFIHTLEGQRTFSPRDRAYVASLLTVALHGKLEYFTDILKTLLNDLVEQYVAKNPKLMLRRTETVVEKLLTNWMSICLYAFLRDSAGESLYMLFRAIKHQVDKGPVDAVTGKAKYTLNDNRLLREDVEYKTLVRHSQPLPSKVLDIDTISQVKEKLLEQVYKGTTYSQRPHVDSLDLEWRSGVAGHLILSDEDLTSVVQGNWKRLNTLQHYKVRVHHCNALPIRAQVATLGTPMLEDADEGGVRLWHLVKAGEEPELPKHRRGSLRERERAKAIPEIYLTRLLSMKGTLQKFVDDLFTVILSTSRPVPLAVKYFFDLLDDQAAHHGITDPETIHIWKTNSLPLRFWINIVKNPQFIFDVQASDHVDAVLSVIAQTFMDSCTVAEHKLGRDSPINKLLYARDIPRYKQMVERYYADIRQTISASDQEMNSALAELSRNYSGELNYLVALHELYKYINKYYDQIITALEEDPTAQKMQLGYRLQQIAAAVENKVTDL